MLCLARGRGLHRSIFSGTNTSSLCQEHVVKEELLNALYCEFINRVNEVGVDVNRAIAHPHSQALLQYVCGLGPRKGTHLLKVRMLQGLPTKPAHPQHSECSGGDSGSRVPSAADSSVDVFLPCCASP